MSKIHDFDFRTGAFVDTVNNTTLTNVSNRKQLKKDLLGYRTVTTVNAAWLNSSIPIKLFDSPVTVEAWVRIDKYDTSGRYYSILGEGSTGIILSYSGVPARIYILNGGAYKGWSRNNVANKGWKHLIFTIPSGIISEINMYLNGILQAVDATSGTLSPLTTSTIDYNSTTLETGGISRIRVYDHILSEQERNDCYTDFLRSYPTDKPVTKFEYPKVNDLSRERDSVISSNLLLAGSGTNYHANSINAWSVYNANTKIQEGNAVKITYVDSVLGANCMFRAVNNTVANNLILNVKYKLKYRYKVTGTLDIRIYNGAAFITIANQSNIDWIEREDEFICATVDNCYMAFLNMSAGESIWVEFLEFKSYQGLVLAYNFKPVGNILLDISGNNRHITNYLTSATTQGIAYSAAKKSYSQLSGNFNVGTTYSFLMRLTPKTADSAIFGNESSSTNNVTITNTLIRYRTALGSLNQGIGTIILGKEITLIFTREDTTVKTYIDGIGYTGILSDNTTFTFRNIAKLFSDYGDIEMRDLRIYNYVISDQQIKDYHNQFAKEIYLQEDFSNNGADGIVKVPKGWNKYSGVYTLNNMIFTNGEDLIKGSLVTANGFSNIGSNIYLYTTSALASTLSKLIYPRGGNFYKLTFTINDNPNGTVFRCTDGASDLFFPGTAFTPGTYTYYSTPIKGMIENGTLTIRVAGGQPSGLIISNLTLTEEPNLSTLINGTNYLECTTAGTISIPSKQAFGTWEYDAYFATDAGIRCDFISTRNRLSNDTWITIPGYKVYNYGTTGLAMLASGSTVFQTATSTIALHTWYRFKITRTINGVFTVYIKGGIFGDNYTLLSNIAGSNPFTNVTNVTSEYFQAEMNTGSRIANIKLTEGIIL